MFVCLSLFLLGIIHTKTIHGFVAPDLSLRSPISQQQQSNPIPLLCQSLQNAEDDNDETTKSSPSSLPWSRREILRYSSSLGLAAPMTATALPQTARCAPTAAESLTTSETNYDLDCLLDLPPIPKDSCRIFLCRHGQTENNRLRLVQGSRLNPPINDIGKQQAERMGLALARADPSPSVLYHSPLKRAQQTAEEANRRGQFLPPGHSPRVLDSLMEVDFGPVAEGQPVKEAKPGMMATYARWSIGDIDYRPEGGGDSGRDIIFRAVEAVTALTTAAASDQCKNRCIAAVTHSTYLRMLLAIFAGNSFAQASNMKTVNGCINVLDVNLNGETRRIGPKDTLVGGLLSRAPRDFNIDIPIAKVIRINEMRHLERRL